MGNKTPLYNSRITNTYLEYLSSHYPELDIPPMLAYAGIENYEVEDHAHWLTQDQVDRLHEIMVEKTGNPNLAREAGRYTILSKKIGAVKEYTMGLMSPAMVFLATGKLYRIMSRGARIETKSISANQVQLKATPNSGVDEKPYQCDNRMGTLESLPKLFTDDFATIEHPKCYHRGDDACLYMISWKTTKSMLWTRASKYALLVTLVLTAISGFVFSTTSTWTLLLMSSLVTLTAYCQATRLKNKELARTITSQGNSAKDLLNAANARYNDMAVIQELASESSAILDVNHLIHRVMPIMQKRLSFDRAMIMLIREDSGTLEYVASYGQTQEQKEVLKQARFNLKNPKARGPFVKAVKEQRPFLVDDVDNIVSSLSKGSKVFAETIASSSFICMPLVYNQEAFGILAVDNWNSNKPLTKSDVGILNGIASQIAAGIANANSFKKLQESEEEFRKLYKESKRAEQLYRSLIQSSADAIATCDLAGHIKYISPEFENVFGWDISELQDSPLTFITKPEYETCHAMIREVAENGNPHRGLASKCYTKEGHLLDVLISASRYDDHNGEPLGLLLIIRDISENKRLEAQLLQAQKMEALGTLAGGIAHDFNNLLAIIKGNLSLMRLDFDSSHPVMDRIQNIDHQVDSGAKLTGQLLGYARKGSYEVKPLDIVQVVNESVQAFGRTRKEITLDVHVPESKLIIEADRTQLEQVLFNLFVNAADAMPNGGNLTIKITRKIAKEILEDNIKPRPGTYILIEVSDTGIGMNPEIQKRMFDPLFTTKKMGKGTGLGLASVYGIIQSYKGYITITSKEGQGTHVRVYLPASDKSTSQTKKAKVSIDRGRGTILLVDDEISLLKVGSEMLSALGYRVLPAGNGLDALETYAEHRKDIDLVILDMIMPGMTGAEVFTRLKKLDPNIIAILSSGYSLDDQWKKVMDSGFRGFLQKPFGMQDLSIKIKEVLT
jgi:PAS domain S-box-containing protein